MNHLVEINEEDLGVLGQNDIFIQKKILIFGHIKLLFNITLLIFFIF